MRGKLSILGVAAVLFGALLFAVFAQGVALAADGDGTTESITLSPVSEHYQLDAGSTKTGDLTIVNDGTTDYDFIVYARPYSVTNSSYTPNFNDTSHANADAYQWVQFPQVKYHLKAGQSTKIPFVIRVPKTAAPGGHYGVMFAETQPVALEGQSSVVRKKRVGAIIYATVKGVYSLEGQTLSTTIPFLQFRPPLTALTTAKNTGNTDFTDTVTYKVTDLFGNVKYQETKDFPVLPQTTRDMKLEWPQAPWFGLYKVQLTSSYLQKSSSQDGLVLMAPKWLLIAVGVIVIGGLIYAVLRRRR